MCDFAQVRRIVFHRFFVGSYVPNMDSSIAISCCEKVLVQRVCNNMFHFLLTNDEFFDFRSFLFLTGIPHDCLCIETTWEENVGHVQTPRESRLVGVSFVFLGWFGHTLLKVPQVNVSSGSTCQYLLLTAFVCQIVKAIKSYLGSTRRQRQISQGCPFVWKLCMLVADYYTCLLHLWQP